MSIDVAHFVSEISTFRHYGKGLPSLRHHIDLLNKGTKARAKATTENDDLILLWTEAGAVREWELEFYLQEFPCGVFDMIPLNSIKSLLTIISTKCIYVFLIYYSR